MSAGTVRVDGWRDDDGAEVTCGEKLRVLAETEAALARSLRDAFEDAVLMGVGPTAYRERLRTLVDGLRDPRRR